MTTLRTDLMELGPEALTALANPGFVKRAQKDIAAGALPGLRQDADGTVHALFDDGVHTSMGPGLSLRDAECSCSAGSMCRHRVVLVLAYQAAHAGGAASAEGDADATSKGAPAAAGHIAAAAAADAAPAAAGNRVPDSQPPASSPAGWSPAGFDDAAIAAAVTPQVLEQAHRLALERPVVTVVAAGAAGSVPAAYLPMSQVRFFSSTSLALARCDCRQGSACAHVVLAAWAFRQAGTAHPGAAEITLEVNPFGVATPGVATPGAETAGAVGGPGGLLASEAAMQVREQTQDWLWSLWREGASQPLPALEARYQALKAELSRLGWTWVREDLDTVWQIVQALAQRSNRFAIDDLIRSSAQLYLRLAGAFHADATPGSRLPASRILGIGQQGEVALDQLRLVSLGVTCWRDASSEGAAIVFADPDTQAACVLERTWPRSADEANDKTDDLSRLLNRRIAGFPLRLLAAGQVVTRAARRRANASVELGSQARQTSVLALSPKAWDDLRSPLRFDTLQALLAHLRSRPPVGIRPGEAAANWHVVDLAGLRMDHWAWDGVQQTLFAHWYDDDGGIALRATLAYQSVTPDAVDALARALDGEWGALRALAGPVRRDQGGVAMQPASVVTEQRAIVLALEPKAPRAMTLREMPSAADAAEALLRESFGLLGQMLRQGVRHIPPALRSRVLAQAEQLDEAGYPQAGPLLRNALAEPRDGGGLAALSGLALLLGELLN